jgi:peptidoglycan/LPS O-acetylase OafA/YrhL
MLESIKTKADERSVVPMFVISRWFRLYPVYIFSIALAIGFHYALNGLELSYPAHFWLPSATIDVGNILGHLTLIGVFDFSRFNNPIWSIIYEMRISILFPIIYMTVRWMRGYSIALVLVMPIAAATALSFPELAEDEYRSALILTLHYSSFFFLGALIAHFRAVLIRNVEQFSTPAAAAILVVAVALYTYGYVVSLPFFVWCLTDLVVGMGSSAIIVLSLAFPILEKSVILRLNRPGFSGELRV